MKRYNIEYFKANVNGVEYNFRAYTTDARMGFCHTIESLDHDITNTKVSYLNRTWESFRYETALYRIIDKFPKGIRVELREQLIEKRGKEETERCEKMVNDFKAIHSSLSEKNKEILAKSKIMIDNENDMKCVMGIMGMMNVMES